MAVAVVDAGGGTGCNSDAVAGGDVGEGVCVVDGQFSPQGQVRGGWLDPPGRINLPIDEALAVEASWFAFAAATGDVSAGLHRFLTRKRP